MRNNNPLNIRKTKDSWLGAVGSEKGFVKFKTMMYGIRAAWRIIRNYLNHGYCTVDAIINRWAPPSENDTDKYVSFVCSKSGFYPESNIITDDDIYRILAPMCLMESGFVLKRGFFDESIRLYY